MLGEANRVHRVTDGKNNGSAKPSMGHDVGHPRLENMYRVAVLYS
jgi:hypothetical protein